MPVRAPRSSCSRARPGGSVSAAGFDSDCVAVTAGLRSQGAAAPAGGSGETGLITPKRAGTEQPHLLPVRQIARLVRSIGRGVQWRLDGERAGQLEEARLVQHVVAGEAGHGLERRAGAAAETFTALELPFPYPLAVTAMILVHGEAKR